MQFKRLASASITRAIAFAAVLAYFLAPALAEEVKAGDLVITQAWSRATPGGAKVGGGYLTIQNKGSTAVRLVGGAADVADKFQVREISTTNVVVNIRMVVNGLSIHATQTI